MYCTCMYTGCKVMWQQTSTLHYYIVEFHRAVPITIISKGCTYIQAVMGFCYCNECYMNIHVPSILAKGVKKINKQTQQTSSHKGLIKFIKHSHNGLENSWNTATKGLENS